VNEYTDVLTYVLNEFTVVTLGGVLSFLNLSLSHAGPQCFLALPHPLHIPPLVFAGAATRRISQCQRDNEAHHRFDELF
jgi:hypothetical protein